MALYKGTTFVSKDINKTNIQKKIQLNTKLFTIYLFTVIEPTNLAPAGLVDTIKENSRRKYDQSKHFMKIKTNNSHTIT